MAIAVPPARPRLASDVRQPARSPVDAQPAGPARPLHHPVGAMTTRPAVSVLLTAFNREAYVAAAIESVLAQTFADFELLVVDDRSTDGTVEIARRYLSDPRVRVIEN